LSLFDVFLRVKTLPASIFFQIAPIFSVFVALPSTLVYKTKVPFSAETDLMEIVERPANVCFN
jgi:hypothetical protein